MSNRGRGWKKSRWGGGWGKREGGGVTSSWRANYRGWLNKGGNAGWGSSLGRMGGRLGGADWGGRRPTYSPLNGSMDPGAGLSSLGQGDARRQTGTGGILSNFQPGWGGGKDKAARPRFTDISGNLESEVRERYERQVTALISRYAQICHDATGDDALQPVVDNLTDMLGPKYARLALDWVHEKESVPDVEEAGRFVVWLVEAAAVDGGGEPLSWKIRRAISAVIEQIFGGRGDEQEKEIQGQGQVGTIPTEA